MTSPEALPLTLRISQGPCGPLGDAVAVYTGGLALSSPASMASSAVEPGVPQVSVAQCALWSPCQGLGRARMAGVSGVGHMHAAQGDGYGPAKYPGRSRGDQGET